MVDRQLIVIPTNRMKAGEEDSAIVCAVPMNAPGVTIINTTFTPRPDFEERFFPYGRHHVMTELQRRSRRPGA